MASKNWPKTMELLHEVEREYGSIVKAPESDVNAIKLMANSGKHSGSYCLSQFEIYFLKRAICGDMSFRQCGKEINHTHRWIEPRVKAVKSGNYTVKEKTPYEIEM